MSGSTDAIGRVIAEMDPRKLILISQTCRGWRYYLHTKILNTVTIVGEVLSPICTIQS